MHQHRNRNSPVRRQQSQQELQQQQQMIKTAMNGSSRKGSSSGGGGILVIGASGRIGSQVIKELHAQQYETTRAAAAATAASIANNTKPGSVTSVPSSRPVYGMCRDITKVDLSTQKCCKSLYQGDARQSNDIQSILYQSRATLIVVCIGSGGDTTTNNNSSSSSSSVRKHSAEAIVEALSDNPSFQNVQVIVVSREQQQQQPKSLLKSMMNSTDMKLRNTLKDHSAQESAFRHGQATTTSSQQRSLISTLSHVTSNNMDYDTSVWSRTLIVRPCMKFEKSSSSSSSNATATATNASSSQYHPTICGGMNFSHYVNLSFNEMLPCVASTTKYDFCKWLVDIIICNENLAKPTTTTTRRVRSNHGRSNKHTTTSSGRSSPVPTITTTMLSSSLNTTTTHSTRPNYYHPPRGGSGGARVSDCHGITNNGTTTPSSSTTKKKRKIVVPPLAPSTHTFAYKHAN